MIEIIGRLPQLTELRPDHIELNAPIVDGAIQIGENNVTPEMLQQLSVDITPDKIVVSHSNQEPLNVDLVTKYENDETLEKKRLLDEPVANFTLRCIAKYSHRWGFDEIAVDDDRLDVLNEFAYVLASHLRRKQKPFR